MKITLCWHMHQPFYRNELEQNYSLPWVYLHAIKDYADMAWHLENHPNMHLVVNFTPSLLEQLNDYADNMRNWLESSTSMNDRLLNLLAGVEAIPEEPTARLKIIKDCLRCNQQQMIDIWPAYKKLTRYAKSLMGKDKEDLAALSYLDSQYFYDLLVWYHLAWLGYSLKQQEKVKQLLEKKYSYNEKDRKELVSIMHDCIEQLIPRYRQLAENGQIELSMTPWGHPIVPLLNDFDNMQCSQPDMPRPESPKYPDGTARSHWHMQHGMEVFENCFGMRPSGVWLSEGGISEDALQCLDSYNINWTASGESVWRHSAQLSGINEHEIADKQGLFQRQQIDGNNCSIFFRDDGLSDLIGFEYQDWSSDDAVANFAMHISNIEEHLGDDADNSLISVILDGENAWEYYPDNGNDFLNLLYSELTENNQIETITFNKALEQLPKTTMPSLCPGSWVYGSFSTWIGEDAKNRAWDLLVKAKQQYDDVMNHGQLDERKKEIANRQLGICEGSDWFWWFGDYNPAQSIQDFDHLYRCQLRQLYKILECQIPPNLDIALSHTSPLPHDNLQDNSDPSGTMRRNI